MASEVEICNLALSNVRGGSINNLNEGSLQAQVCKLRYPLMRDFLLSEMMWQFGRKIKPLSPVTTDIFNWSYAYQYPTDCLKINRLVGSYEELQTGSVGLVSRLVDERLLPIGNMRQQIPYAVFTDDSNKIIGTNMADMRIEYTARITDPNLFSSEFILAFSYLLSAEIAIPIVGAEMGRALRSDSLQLYKSYMATAIASDMNEGYDVEQESEFITARR